MKIAIDVSSLKSTHKFRGVGSYTRHLIEALQRVDKKNKYVLIDQQSTINNQQFDLVHYPYFDLFWLTLPLRKSWPTVVTIHDLIPLVFPDKFPKGIKGWMRYQIQRQSLQGVDAIIADSECSKKDIIKFIGFPEKKVHVVYLAPGKEFKQLTINNQQLAIIQKKYSLPNTFVLYVGDVNWNKNIPGLIKAFKQITEHTSEVEGPPPKLLLRRRNVGGGDTSEVTLVLVGKAFEEKDLKETKEMFQLIKELGLINQIKILGYVPDEDLVGIYNLATVYCQPSFYEGFGLPVLEAMACGTPVVAAKTSSLPEICGDAAMMVDPYKIDNIVRGIKKVISDKIIRDKLVKKGLTQARKFSWEKTARETIKVYEKIYEG